MVGPLKGLPIECRTPTKRKRMPFDDWIAMCRKTPHGRASKGSPTPDSLIVRNKLFKKRKLNSNLGWSKSHTLSYLLLTRFQCSTNDHNTLYVLHTLTFDPFSVQTSAQVFKGKSFDLLEKDQLKTDQLGLYFISKRLSG